jgi:hypothetical protein
MLDEGRPRRILQWIESRRVLVWKPARIQFVTKETRATKGRERREERGTETARRTTDCKKGNGRRYSFNNGHVPDRVLYMHTTLTRRHAKPLASAKMHFIGFPERRRAACATLRDLCTVLCRRRFRQCTADVVYLEELSRTVRANRTRRVRLCSRAPRLCRCVAYRSLLLFRMPDTNEHTLGRQHYIVILDVCMLISLKSKSLAQPCKGDGTAVEMRKDHALD